MKLIGDLAAGFAVTMIKYEKPLAGAKQVLPAKHSSELKSLAV